MFKPILKFEGELTVESIKKELEKLTGEKDFFGFESCNDPEKLLEDSVRDGFIEKEGAYIIINADMV